MILSVNEIYVQGDFQNLFFLGSSGKSSSRYGTLKENQYDQQLEQNISENYFLMIVQRVRVRAVINK